MLTHCDGENRDLLPQFPKCGFDVAESVCPAPMTHCSLAQLRSAVPTITIWGGIPSISLLQSTMSDREFEAYLGDLFDNLGRGDRLILGVSDNVPPEADLARLDSIRQKIEDFGPVQPV